MRGCPLSSYHCAISLFDGLQVLARGPNSNRENRQVAASATELVSRRHLDGVFIDRDDIAGGAEVVVKVRNSRSNRETLIVAVANGLTSVEKALNLGANFVLCKPVQEARLRSALDIAFQL